MNDKIPDLFAPDAPPPPPPEPVEVEAVTEEEFKTAYELRVLDAEAFPVERLPTEDQMTVLLDHLEAGVPVDDALNAAAIEPEDYFSAMECGVFAAAGPVRDFYLRVRKVRPVLMKECLDKIQSATGKGSWRASAWLLQRLDPEHFGESRAVRAQMKDTITELLKKVIAILVDEVQDKDVRQRIQVRFRAELGSYTV